MTPIVVLGFFIVVAIAAFALLAYLDEGRGQSRLLRERLQSVGQAERRGPSEELTLLRDELLSEIPALNRMLSGYSRITSLQRFLLQAEMKWKAGKFLLVTAAIAVVLGLFTRIVSNSGIMALVAFFVGVGLPFAYVAHRRSRRFGQFEAKFPEAIEFLARAIRAGHAFSTALEMIGQEMAEPVAGEFRAVYEEQKFGLPLRDAMLNFAERMPIVDVKFFVTSILLQRETGGNLAEILDKLSYVIRERFKILRQVKTYTAQGRMTMWILMSLPPGVCLLMLLVNREFILPLFFDPLGHMFLVFGITMQTIGFFLIRRIIHIQV